MIELRITGTREELLGTLVAAFPAWTNVERRVRTLVGPPHKKEVWVEQAAAIAMLAAQCNRAGANVLEIGANRGFTAGIMKIAAPHARVTTLEPDKLRRRSARQNIGRISVSVRPETSTAYLELTADSDVRYDLIFVDGDHKHIRADLPWWNRLAVGGLFLHHDYSPPESSRPCPPVWEALNEFAAKMGREPDVLVVDDSGTGLWGMYRREGEAWAP